VSRVVASVARPFQPGRLRLARSLRGIPQNKLAEAVAISPTAISQFESGSASPGPETLQRIAVSLGCLPSFFSRPMPDRFDREPFFRSRRSATKRERDRALAFACVMSEISTLLEARVALPELNLPDRLLGLSLSAHLEEIEEAAVELRSAWRIPEGPIANMVRLLEARGVIVSAVGEFQRVDAFSMRTDHRPVVVLSSDGGSAARRRFDAAHELAHLVLHPTPMEANEQQERQAHNFAAALLMPAGAVDPWLPRKSNQLELLEDGSAVWGVSMQALLYRAKTLGRLSEDAHRRTMRRISSVGWRTKEPVEIGPPEVPALLRMAVGALPAAGSSLEAMAASLGVSPQRLRRMLRLPEERTDGGELAQLRVRAA
jgi:Zn-dependent peptidase ImmA (M78 family)/DNA-binding XRE family transcriptional regulator